MLDSLFVLGLHYGRLFFYSVDTPKASVMNYFSKRYGSSSPPAVQAAI